MVVPHRAWAEIDLEGLTHNLSTIRKLAGPGVRTMMVVKADAYGHGAVALSHHAIRQGVASLGVGDSHEALELRAAGVQAPIVVLGTVIDDEIKDLLTHQIEITIHSKSRIRSLDREAARRNTVARIHLNVDTGMGRLGIFPEMVSEVLQEFPRCKHVRLVGLMTHLACADGMQNPFTQTQIKKFEAAVQTARTLGMDIPQLHVANSAALFTGLKPLHNMVRTGIAVYGILPGSLQGKENLRPLLSLRSQIVFLKDHPAGSSIGYNRSHRTDGQTRIATIPIGYNDGLAHRLSNQGHVLVRGKRAPIVGAISMDYTTIDIGKIRGARVGDVVTLIGRDGREEIRAEQLAQQLGTIPYEVTCAIGKRVRREYLPASAPISGTLPSRAQAAG